jgi:hypothetical protein
LLVDVDRTSGSRMSASSPSRRVAHRSATACAAVLTAAAVLPAATASAHNNVQQHVLLLSVDGMHQTDLARYVSDHAHSALAALVHRGESFTGAQTPVPSDSFPGMLGQVTGGNPKTTGIYYDVSYDHALLPAGTTDCSGSPALGAPINDDESAGLDSSRLDAGQGLSGLPDSILKMSGTPVTLLNTASFPVDPATCKPVLPHQQLRVNTVFEVARQHGLRTAWSDKHVAYDILQGPSGNGISDLFAPEVNSDTGEGTDWTGDNAKTQQYDGYKVRAVLNEIDGLDHSGTRHVGPPALFGMNFQSVSTAEKLPSSGGRPGGYSADGQTPGPVLASALAFVDQQVGAMLTELKKQHLDKSTTVILSAKHGQSPTDPAALLRIPDGPIRDGLNSAWAANHPGAAPLVASATDDDAMIIWLSDRSAAATTFAKNYLLGHDGTGNDINGDPKAYHASGLATVYAGADAAAYFGTAPGDSRVPDLYAVAQHGVVFTGKKGKIAEHGGADPQDRNVPLVITGPGVEHGSSSTTVETTQIAPTILQLLGLDPRSLQAVQSEHTDILPLGDDRSR